MVNFFFGSVVLMTKFSGNVAGNIHQIPSVSNSSGRPIFSINSLALVIIVEPVWHTIPAYNNMYKICLIIEYLV